MTTRSRTARARANEGPGAAAASTHEGEESAPADEAPTTPRAEDDGGDDEGAHVDAHGGGPTSPGEVPADSELAELELAELALDDDELDRVVAAVLFAAREPLSVRKIAKAIDRSGRLGDERVRAAMASLGERLASAGLPIELREIAGGWQLLTVPAVAGVVSALFSEHRVEKLSPAALETLAVVAYRQPVTKAEIEAVRGVQAGPILRTLIDRTLVRVVGRADQPGSPLLYGTTREFLDRFGLARIEDLPRDPELLR